MSYQARRLKSRCFSISSKPSRCIITPRLDLPLMVKSPLMNSLSTILTLVPPLTMMSTLLLWWTLHGTYRVTQLPTRSLIRAGLTLHQRRRMPSWDSLILDTRKVQLMNKWFNKDLAWSALITLYPILQDTIRTNMTQRDKASQVSLTTRDSMVSRENLTWELALNQLTIPSLRTLRPTTKASAERKLKRSSSSQRSSHQSIKPTCWQESETSAYPGEKEASLVLRDSSRHSTPMATALWSLRNSREQSKTLS